MKVEELREARERLEAAGHILTGLMTLLRAKSSIAEDIRAVCGALVLVQENVQEVRVVIEKLTREIDGGKESE